MDLAQITAVALWTIVPLIALGSLLHFVYQWTGGSRIAAVFSAVNESYWEHIKIAVWPVVLLDVILFAAGGHRYGAFLPAATVALYSIPISMIGIVLLYKAFTRRNVLWLDITVFAICIALAQLIFVGLIEQLRPTTVTIIISGMYLGGILGAFLRFTLRPPAEPDPFIDPITGTYGEPPAGAHGHQH